MALLIATPDRDAHELARHIQYRDPEIDLRIWPEMGDTSEIAFVLAWKPPDELFRQLPNLQAVSSLGAGVDALIDRADIPARVDIGRLAGPRLAANMAAYLVAMVVGDWKGLAGFVEDQKNLRWNPWAPESPPAVGLLGMGQMGQHSAAAFAELGFRLHGFSRSGKGPASVEMHSGQKGLAEIARVSDYLVNLLPLTDGTRGILDRALFSKMKQGSTLINVGRGEHLVEQDLLDALKVERPGCAMLDVFRQEPLPGDHPFWTHPDILITPHCASITLTVEAAELAVESYRRVLAGKTPLGMVDRERGY
ncbi:MAG TPA: glyoxylate/hydroxypyruvate reductase A [Wenzhouxiangellaceae bacterium]|nr:glyoxylate/hydroxypyruvate reductase A [Wenzhouxiangellaceae bacterium]